MCKFLHCTGFLASWPWFNDAVFIAFVNCYYYQMICKYISIERFISYSPCNNHSLKIGNVKKKVYFLFRITGSVTVRRSYIGLDYMKLNTYNNTHFQSLQPKKGSDFENHQPTLLKSDMNHKLWVSISIQYLLYMSWLVMTVMICHFPIFIIYRSKQIKKARLIVIVQALVIVTFFSFFCVILKKCHIVNKKQHNHKKLVYQQLTMEIQY